MRFEGTQVVYLVFESGVSSICLYIRLIVFLTFIQKLVVTGSKSEQEAQSSYNHVVGILDSVYKTS